MNKVAILYICIGKYVVFWREFYESYEKLFLSSSHKEYFVFTDQEKVCYEDNENVHIIFQKDLGWPGNTLFRFKIFIGIEEQLNRFDYCFFMNANMLCNEMVMEKDFLPIKEDILVVQHPGFYNKPCYKYPYDRNKKSSAYMSYNQGDVYVCGGVNGGKTRSFMNLCHELSNNIDEDYEKGIVALWHDESQINKYIWLHSSYRVLTPAFCFPEGSKIPFPQTLIVREKSKYFDVKKIKHFKKIDVNYRRCKDFMIRYTLSLYYLIKKRV